MKKLLGLIVLLSTFGISNAQLTMKKAEGGILIVDGDQKVLQFQAETKSLNGEYSRCNYIHPLWGFDGQVLTEDFPADHPHHRGIFWAWHQVFIGDKQIGDPWILEDFEQEVLELEFVKQQNGVVQITTEVDWKSNKWRKSGKQVPYLKEKANIIVYPKQANFRKIDFEISLLALEEGLKIGGSNDEKGYSGFSVRMLLPDDIQFLGAKGKIEPENTAVKSDAYINISGSLGVNGKAGGIVILDNSENPGYPQSWILRSKNSMQNIVWPGRETIDVSTSEPLVLKYSLLVYSGKMNHKRICKLIK